MKLRANEEYFPKEIESKKIWSTMIIPYPYKKYLKYLKIKEIET